MPIASPFLRVGSRSAPMAAWALLALMVPCAIYSILYDPTFIWKLIGYAFLGAFAETLYTLIVKRKRRLVCTGAALSAALLAASVPPSMPFLPMLLAILIAVWIVKLPMVGLPLRFNAAMVGRLFLMLAYPNHVVNWGTPTADVISTATPQELYRSEGFALDWPQLLIGKIEGVWEGLFLLVPGSPGETYPLILLLLGGLLCWKGITAWRTPAAFLLSFTVSTALCGHSPLINLFSAATLSSAVFIVSDPVSTPMSKSGQLACGIIIGASNALIRHFTFYTEAIVYAVLLGNLCTPLLDRIAFEVQGRKLAKRSV
ncbi:Na(+)-translocating NADH-quinone reductase subunit B [Pontiella desulfatans]|uniref:Na(+)-translocating NADH-quinone reductase subunit B n=1 Tax=Pontiella desulfatans TaxID=2750659 RepID=A0A6C2U5E9_PONDE|nr:RnfABCDGE type electron transport complex subunit D [Pontiella desulfatans]VGO15298.1 Na(+)-translocating NADH-quinone reductase subunit B [Pontiella desulfatans]